SGSWVFPASLDRATERGRWAEFWTNSHVPFVDFDGRPNAKQPPRVFHLLAASEPRPAETRISLFARPAVLVRMGNERGARCARSARGRSTAAQPCQRSLRALASGRLRTSRHVLRLAGAAVLPDLGRRQVGDGRDGGRRCRRRAGLKRALGATAPLVGVQA